MSLTRGDQGRRLCQPLPGCAARSVVLLALALNVCFAQAELVQAQNQGSVQDKQKPPDKDNTGAAKDEVYTPGGDVKSPKLVHYVEPAFSSSSQEAFVEGVVRIVTVVKRDGLPSDLHIAKGLTTEEDQKALDAVAKWRFEPGTRRGQPVNVRVTVEVEFHLM